MHQGYDLIGDIHGCGKTLVDLLEQMGYRKIADTQAPADVSPRLPIGLLV